MFNNSEFTVADLCNFVKTFGKVEICPLPKVPMYTFRVWLEGPTCKDYDDFKSIENNFTKFIFKNNFKYDFEKHDSLHLYSKHQLTINGKNPSGVGILPEGISTLEICMPGEGWDKNMGKNVIGHESFTNRIGDEIHEHLRCIDIYMWETADSYKE